MRYTRASILILLLAGLSHAQQSAPSDREMIQQLVRQVQALQDRVRVLESQPPINAAPNPDAATPQPVSIPVSQAAAESAQPAPLPEDPHELHGIQWRGFGEVDYKVLNQRKPELATYGFVSGSHGNFYTGDFDLLLTARINDRASVLSEIVFGEQDAQKYGVDLERVFLSTITAIT
jgi:hypothetical protein